MPARKAVGVSGRPAVKSEVIDRGQPFVEELPALDVDDVVIEAKPKVPHGPTGFTVVSHPVLTPHYCVVCLSATGPLVDTQRDILADFNRDHGFRVYICAQCMRLGLIELGLVEGERMDELLQAGALLDDAQERLSDRDAQIGRMLSESAAATRKIEALEELLRQERDAQRAQRHMLEMINETSKQLLTVGNGS